MKKRRLLKLADFLDTVPRNKFDIGRWFSPVGEGAVFPVGEIPVVGACNTTACAAGWATTIPTFKRAGLHLEPSERYGVDGETGLVVMIPAYGDLRTQLALEAFFGLPGRLAEFIFMPIGYRNGYATPKEVAKKIRRVVAEA